MLLHYDSSENNNNSISSKFSNIDDLNAQSLGISL